MPNKSPSFRVSCPPSFFRILSVMVVLLAGVWLGSSGRGSENEATESKPLRIVCFGDSLTGNRPGEVYLMHYVKYTDMLGLMLEARVGVGNVKLFNSGWAGDSTRPKPNENWPGARGRVQSDILDHNPDIAIILIGGNNRADTDEKRAQLKEDLTAIVTETQNAGIKVLMLLYPPAMPAEEHKDKGWFHLSEYSNPVIREVAEENEGVALLDLGPPLVAAAEAQGRNQLFNDRDGVHLKPGAEVVFARTIFAKLMELGWVPEPAPAPAE